jgi:Rrf2 family protein
LIDLGIAHELGRPILRVSELVEKERLPKKFLEQILYQLKGAGYIDTQRGKSGGYMLARPMREISLGGIIRLIDGPLAPIACVSITAYERCTCPDEEHCGLRMLMLDVRNAIARILDRYVLADIVEITLRKMRRDGTPIPFMLETLLRPTPPKVPAPPHEEAHPEGSFLDEFVKGRGPREDAGESLVSANAKKGRRK